ncbi:MAG: C4-dicarboxylate ABC transporter permease [Rhodospirillaceae bacterium]|nr:C4-dicarboxylate ABC transporter permease [Rhodospirillaceae bacterium]
MTLILVLGGLFLLLLLGVDIAFALAGLGTIMIVVGGFSPLIVPQGLLASMDNFILLAVPLFILMSQVLLKGGAGDDLFNAVQSWVGHWPGGLAVATILSCTIFASISGSSVATAATIGTVAIPAMIGRGYDRRFVYGLLAAGGTIGILIPPSIPMIVYGVVVEESILDLFLAGIVPGLMLTVLFIGFSVLHARMSGRFEPLPRAGRAERLRTTKRALPTMVLGAVIILGIYLGVFTPTEASGVGFVAALVITLFVKRSLKAADLPAVAMDALKTTVMVLFIIAGAKVFGQAITLYRIPQDVTALVTETLTSPLLFIVAICGLLLVMGCVLETLSMMLLMLPIIEPSLRGLAIDPIWFGVIFTMMIECALITPPVGLNLFVIQAVANQSRPGGPPVEAGDVVSGVLPFLVLMLLAVIAVILVPDLALTVPFHL